MTAIIISLMLSAFQLYAINLAVKNKNAYLSIMHMFLIYPVIALQIVPLLINLVLLKEGTSDDQFALVLVYVLGTIYIIFFLLIWKYLTNYKNNQYILGVNSSFEISLLLFATFAFNIASLISYLKFYDIDLEEIMFPFYSFVQNISRVAPFIIYMFTPKDNRKIRILAFISIVAMFSSVIPTGHRGTLVMPLIFLIFYSPELKIKKKLIIASMLLLIFIPFADFYKSLRIITNPSEVISSQEHFSRNFFEEVEYRLGENNKISTGIGRMLIDNPGVGFRPLLSSLSAIIPASLMESEKDWPGSIDGTSFGILARLAHEYVSGDFWNMSEYIYALHPVWELGYGYFLINIIISALYLVLLEKVSRLINDKNNLIVIASFLPFSYSMVAQPLVFILQGLAYIVLPGLILALIYLFLKFIFINIRKIIILNNFSHNRFKTLKH